MKEFYTRGSGTDSEDAPTIVQATTTAKQEISTLVVMEVLDIGLKRPAISPPTIKIPMLFMMIKVLECLLVMEDVDFSLKRPSTVTLTIMEFLIMEIEVVTT